MTDDDDRAVGLLREPAGNAPGESLVRLAVDSVKIPFELLEIGAHPGTDLAAVEPVPGAERNLAQPIVEAQRRGVSQALGDDLGAAPRPADRARDNRGADGFGQRAQP